MPGNIDFLVKDYELKIDYLKDHYSRSLTRFNFFLTINSALFAFVFKDAGVIDAVLISAFGLALSTSWFLFSAADSYVGENYRKAISQSFECIKDAKNGGGREALPDTLVWAGYPGEKEGKPSRLGVKPTRLSKKYLDLGVTKVGAITAILFAAAWLLSAAIASFADKASASSQAVAPSCGCTSSTPAR